jgi:3-isopropylmalate dehydratase small subunit
MILVTGANFGCGSSREIGAAVFKSLGVPAILAESFARHILPKCNQYRIANI